MSEYAGNQFVGIDVHRRRSVIVQTTAAGEPVEVVRMPWRRAARACTWPTRWG